MEIDKMKNEMKYAILIQFKFISRIRIDDILKKLYHYKIDRFFIKDRESQEHFESFVNDTINELVFLQALSVVCEGSVIYVKGTEYPSILKVIMITLCKDLEVYITNVHSDYPSVGYNYKGNTILVNHIVTLGLDAYSAGLIKDL